MWAHFRVFSTVVETTLAMLAGLFVITVFLAQFDNTPPIRFVASAEHVTSEPDGTAFFGDRTICLDREKQGESVERLIGIGNDLMIPLRSKPFHGRLGCHVYKELVLIPEQTPEGEYEYRLTVRFRLNPFKDIYVDAPSVRVTVIK